MYSSLNDPEYRLRKAKAEQEARRAYEQVSPPLRAEEKSSENGDVLPAFASHGFLQKILSRVRDDDLLILGMLLLLFNESKEDDPLILIILAVLLFT